MNPLKLQRALANVVAKVGPKFKESDVKNLYIQYGGLVVEAKEENDSSLDSKDNQSVKEE